MKPTRMNKFQLRKVLLILRKKVCIILCFLYSVLVVDVMVLRSREDSQEMALVWAKMIVRKKLNEIYPGFTSTHLWISAHTMLHYVNNFLI